MPIVWTQLFNAVTMVSPLIALISHIKTNSIHKRIVGKTLIIHIPISFTYHLTAALNAPVEIVNKFKKADLALIHIYAITANHSCKRNSTKSEMLISRTLSSIMNTACTYRVCNGFDNILFRMSSLYVASYNILQKHERKLQLIMLAITSSTCFYFDTYLLGFGHPTFHILLGILQHNILQHID